MWRLASGIVFLGRLHGIKGSTLEVSMFLDFMTYLHRLLWKVVQRYFKHRISHPGSSTLHSDNLG